MTDHIHENRILIVDDTPDNVDILGEVLADYKKLVALNGEKALKIAFGDTKPDLILLDVMMPGMSGFDVCKILKEDDRTKDIPVIFITAKSEINDEIKGLELGAVDFIPKPISPPVVLARVRNHLELKAAQEKLKEQNEKLSEHNKYITDSINYAKRIQSAILQDGDQLRKLFRESFLIYYPKDIVSGDFYWFSEVNGVKIIAVVDCTGHGVPGSMMSMIGNTLLNEIVKISKVTDAGEILNQLDRRLITELHKGIYQATYDGMDLALCVIDEVAKTVSFAGSYRPLYYFSDGIFAELKGQKKSIGDKKKSMEFKSQIIHYENVISLYLLTDGMPDQCDEQGNKYSTARFKSLLHEINEQNILDQQKKIIEELESYRQNEIQRDDITIIGIRIDAGCNKSNGSLIYSFQYDGLFSHRTVEEIFEKFENDVSALLPAKSFKTFIFCVTELIQNIGHYSAKRRIDESGKEYGEGSIFVEIEKNMIRLRTVNLVSASQFNKVLFMISHINSLTDEELKELKKKKIKSERDNDSRGGGIGFIEIRRRTSSKILMNKELPADNYLTLELTINY